MKVEIEIEVLETLIYATAVIKQIESALIARKQDPFIQPHLHYTAAVNAATEAMNHARRSAAETKTGWDEPLTEKEVLFIEKELEGSLVESFSGVQRQKHKEIDTLAEKGCVLIGQRADAVVWPGATQADLATLNAYAVKLTTRGYEKYEAAKNQK